MKWDLAYVLSNRSLYSKIIFFNSADEDDEEMSSGNSEEESDENEEENESEGRRKVTFETEESTMGDEENGAMDEDTDMDDLLKFR